MKAQGENKTNKQTKSKACGCWMYNGIKSWSSLSSPWAVGTPRVVVFYTVVTRAEISLPERQPQE